MNLLNAYITEVIKIEVWTPPEELFPKYIVHAKYTCWTPEELTTTLQFDTLEEAEKVKPGFHIWR